jgi:hypothetical protein
LIMQTEQQRDDSLCRCIEVGPLELLKLCLCVVKWGIEG